MAKAMTVAQLISHIITNCPSRADKAFAFLDDCLRRFQVQAFMRGRRSALRQTPDVLDEQ
jgi:hypothetical protein